MKNSKLLDLDKNKNYQLLSLKKNCDIANDIVIEEDSYVDASSNIIDDSTSIKDIIGRTFSILYDNVDKIAIVGALIIMIFCINIAYNFYMGQIDLYRQQLLQYELMVK